MISAVTRIRTRPEPVTARAMAKTVLIFTLLSPSDFFSPEVMLSSSAVERFSPWALFSSLSVSDSSELLEAAACFYAAATVFPEFMASAFPVEPLSAVLCAAAAWVAAASF